MSSHNKSKSSGGLRMLWIPGRRKQSHKGRYDATNKQISYTGQQKKTQFWSLGGSKAQRDIIKADPESGLFDGPSVSRLAPVTCAAGATGVVNAPRISPPTGIEKSENAPTTEHENNLPHTPGSSTSTAPLISIPNSPEPTTNNATTTTMLDTTNPPPVIITTTATAEIIDDTAEQDAFEIYEMPSPPRTDLIGHARNGTTASTPATASLSTSPQPGANPQNSEPGTPAKKSHRNHNNNQGDVNSIESVSDGKIPNSNLDWMDDLLPEPNGKDSSKKSKTKKKKKNMKAKEMDQLDGVPGKANNKTGPPEDEDENLVKCLYYTLMCCDCTIS